MRKKMDYLQADRLKFASATLMGEEFLSATACKHASSDDTSGVLIVSREAAM
jgi:hypothetical protein